MLDCVAVAICGGMGAPLFFGGRRIGDGGVSHFVEREMFSDFAVHF